MTEDAGLWVGAEVRYLGPDTDGLLRSGLRGHVIETTAGRGGDLMPPGRPTQLRPGEVLVLVAEGTAVAVPAADLEVLTPPHPLRPEPQGAQADWLLRALRPWTSGDQTLPVASFVPAPLPEVVKVLHPWVGTAADVVATWAQVAAQSGKRSLQALSETRSTGGPPEASGWRSPSQGRLDHRTAGALVEVLQSATDVAQDVFVAVWTGWADFPYQRFAGAAVLPTEARGHRLLRGPLDGVLEPVSTEPMDVETSGIWWPADRSWVVVTEVDFEWTFVAGREALMADLVRHPALEVLKTDMDAPANRLDQDRPA